MGRKYKIIFGVLLSLVAIAATAAYLKTVNIEVLNPKGIIAHKQFDLIVFAAALSLLVIVPVYVLLFTFLFKYRDTNKKKAKYTPDWDSNKKYEAIWWGLPITLIVILSVVTWNSTHALDPFRPLDSAVKPINVQVVALQWKWLFIYPDENVATLNYVRVPVDTPIQFTITADSPMNSFWVPQLGGQIYAMTGMSTQLHLMADTVGVYNGSSANISGEGFANMRFKVDAVSSADYESWLFMSKNSQNPPLNQPDYEVLAKPSQAMATATFSPVQPGLYDTIMMKYMEPISGSQTESHGGH